MKVAPGEMVTVREWDDMAKEYGLTYAKSINCKGRFIDSMSMNCGKTFEVEEIIGDRIYFKGDPLKRRYFYTTDMFTKKKVIRWM